MPRRLARKPAASWIWYRDDASSLAEHDDVLEWRTVAWRCGCHVSTGA